MRMTLRLKGQCRAYIEPAAVQNFIVRLIPNVDRLAVPRKGHRQEDTHPSRRCCACEHIFGREPQYDRRQRTRECESRAAAFCSYFFHEASRCSDYKRK